MSRRDIISVLDVDPDLGGDLAPEELELATRTLLARVHVLEPGRWRAAEDLGEEHPLIGLLVVDGLLSRQVTVARRPSTELLGPTDLLRPWDQDGEIGVVPMQIEWHVLARSRVAVLDQRFLRLAARWPQVIDALMARTLRRSRWLAFLLAMKQIMRVEGRLLVLLWALSERWGVVTPRGVHLRLRLTHEALAKLVGARRPSVTTALGQLAGAGLVTRTEEGYLLSGSAEDAMHHAAGEHPAEPVL